MDRMMLTRFKDLFKKSNITLPQLYRLFYIENNFKDLLDEIEKFLIENMSELAYEGEFFHHFHLFLFNIAQDVHNQEDLYALKNLIDHLIRELKLELKPYHKKEIAKDMNYSKYTYFIKQLEYNLTYLDSNLFELSENKDFKIIWFIINELRNPDYLFRIIELNPNIVNTKNMEDSSLFYKLVEYYTMNINEIDTKYYKRIIVMLLESDKLRISNKELFDILHMLEVNITHSSIENKRELNFITQELNRHYTMFNVDGRTNAISSAKNKMKIIASKPSMYNRCDLTKLFTLSIDSSKEYNIKNILVDDAYSIEKCKNGNYRLLIHIPDVDAFIERDTEEDEILRNIGESIYTKDFKVPLIEYEEAKKMSLSQGIKRPAITFSLMLDSNFNILKMNVVESIINVNYNLSIKKAETFLENCHDDELKNKLKLLYQIAKVFRKNRKEKIGKIRKPQLIMDELNIILNLYVAQYFNDNNIVFPYKNYFGLRSHTDAKYIELCNNFVNENQLTDKEKELIYSIFNINNRVFYDTTPYPNQSFKGQIVGNVGNPLREYISLETLRLIKDLLIKKLNNIDYWEDRILKDVIDYTETSAKVRELYTRN